MFPTIPVSLLLLSILFILSILSNLLLRGRIAVCGRVDPIFTKINLSTTS